MAGGETLMMRLPDRKNHAEKGFAFSLYPIIFYP
jgi:hypothetical protein